MAEEIGWAAAGVAGDVLVVAFFELPAEAGADLGGVFVAGADFAGVVLGVDVLARPVVVGLALVGVALAGVVFLAEALVVVFDGAAPDLEDEVLVARFGGAADEPRVDVVFLPAAAVVDGVSASSAGGLSGLVTASAVPFRPEAVREDPGRPRRSAAARAIAPAMS